MKGDLIIILLGPQLYTRKIPNKSGYLVIRQDSVGGELGGLRLHRWSP